jgi:hypothetical protein
MINQELARIILRCSSFVVSVHCACACTKKSTDLQALTAASEILDKYLLHSIIKLYLLILLFSYFFLNKYDEKNLRTKKHDLRA